MLSRCWFVRLVVDVLLLYVIWISGRFMCYVMYLMKCVLL